MTYPQPGAPGYYPPAATTPSLASWIQRVGAYLIDALIPAPVFLIGALVGRSDDGTPNALYFVFYVLGIALSGYNRWFMGGKTGQSWGKKALSLRLVGEQTGQPIGPGMAFVRDLAHIVDSIICSIGYLFPLWDAKKQTLADKIVKTVVIR